MTDDEFKRFSIRLGSAFPSLWDWLSDKSPDMGGTLAVWRDCLRPYRLDECLDVVDRWSTGRLKPFENYERDRVHLLVRAIVERDRDITRKLETKQADLVRYDLRRKRGPADYAAILEQSGSSVVGAFRELLAVSRKRIEGAISEDEYSALKSQILDSVA